MTTYVHDGAGRLTGVTLSGQTRSFQYDTAGRLVVATNPESGAINYRYDDAGNLVQRTDARSVTTCTGAQAGATCADPAMAHDGLNRPVKKTYSSGGAAVNYTYDSCAGGIGRLCGVSVVGGTALAYGYNAAGRVANSSQTTDGVTYAFSYTYNAAGGLEVTTLPSGRALTQCYDRAGRARSVTGSKPGGPTLSYVSQASYDAGGGINQALLGNGKWQDWGERVGLIRRVSNFAQGGRRLCHFGDFRRFRAGGRA